MKYFYLYTTVTAVTFLWLGAIWTRREWWNAALKLLFFTLSGAGLFLLARVSQ